MAPPMICMQLSTVPQQSPTACCTVSASLRSRQPACFFALSCCLMGRRATRDAPPLWSSPRLRSFLMMRMAQRRSVAHRRRRRRMPIRTQNHARRPYRQRLARCRHLDCRHCHRPSPGLQTRTHHRARRPYHLRNGRRPCQRGPSHGRGTTAPSAACSWCSTRCTTPRCWLPCSGRCVLTR